MLTEKAIKEFKEYLESGRWDEDYGYRTPDGQAEMLDMIESIFELCELADKILSEKLYKQMGSAGVGTQ